MVGCVRVWRVSGGACEVGAFEGGACEGGACEWWGEWWGV